MVKNIPGPWTFFQKWWRHKSWRRTARTFARFLRMTPPLKKTGSRLPAKKHLKIVVPMKLTPSLCSSSLFNSALNLNFWRSWGFITFLLIGTVENSGTKLFIMLTNSFAGGLPIGLVMVSSENTKLLTTAFTQFKKLAGNKGFYGQGTILFHVRIF